LFCIRIGLVSFCPALFDAFHGGLIFFGTQDAIAVAIGFLERGILILGGCILGRDTTHPCDNRDCQ
jgi:hypothetical protein